jgi:hypothetical protein
MQDEGILEANPNGINSDKFMIDLQEINALREIL